MILSALKVKIKYRKNECIYKIVIQSKALFLKKKKVKMGHWKTEIKHLCAVVFHKT